MVMRLIFSFLLLFFFVISGSHASGSAQPRTHNDSLQLSLRETILLAVRTNPNVQIAELNDVLQKFNVFIQQWAFYPHYGLQLSALYAQSAALGQPKISSHSYNAEPSITMNTPIGTQISLTSTNTETDRFSTGHICFHGH